MTTTKLGHRGHCHLEWREGRACEFLPGVERPAVARIITELNRRLRSIHRSYLATNKFSAKGHSWSIHCALQKKPVSLAMCDSSWGQYLWLLSVQMVSPSANETLNCARGIVTLCFRCDRRCISTLRCCGWNLATCSNCSRMKSASSSRLMRASRFRLKADVTPNGSS